MVLITTLFPDCFCSDGCQVIRISGYYPGSEYRAGREYHYNRSEKTQNEASVQFKNIEDFCSEREIRVREQESHTSRDSILVDIPPFDPNIDDDAFLGRIVFFVTKFQRYELEPSKIKMCYCLPGRAEEKDLVPSVIVRSLYLCDKNQIYANQRYLKGISKKRFKSKEFLRMKKITCNGCLYHETQLA